MPLFLDLSKKGPEGLEESLLVPQTASADSRRLFPSREATHEGKILYLSLHQARQAGSDLEGLQAWTWELNQATPIKGPIKPKPPNRPDE